MSVVVPVFDEQENAEPLVREIAAAVRALGIPAEVIVVDDGSEDDTVSVLRSLVGEVPELRVVELRRNFGQTLALQAGLDQARGDVIVTMDGDLQNDPADIPRLLERIEAGADLVSGWRRQRQDVLVLRKIPSMLANSLIRRVTRVPIHDQGCALKAYRRDVIQGLDLYSDMHRFIATLTMPLGGSIEEIEVHHRARVAGESKYGLSRVFKVLTDLLTIKMLIQFRESPMRWFAWLGAPFLLGAVLSALLAFWSWPGTIPLYGVLMICGTFFVSCLLFGLLAEAIVEMAGPGRARSVVRREWRSLD